MRKSEAEGNIIIPRGIFLFLDNNQMSPSSVNNLSIDTKINKYDANTLCLKDLNMIANASCLKPDDVVRQCL